MVGPGGPSSRGFGGGTLSGRSLAASSSTTTDAARSRSHRACSKPFLSRVKRILPYNAIESVPFSTVRPPWPSESESLANGLIDMASSQDYPRITPPRPIRPLRPALGIGRRQGRHLHRLSFCRGRCWKQVDPCRVSKAGQCEGLKAQTTVVIDREIGARLTHLWIVD